MKTQNGNIKKVGSIQTQAQHTNDSRPSETHPVSTPNGSKAERRSDKSCHKWANTGYGTWVKSYHIDDSEEANHDNNNVWEMSQTQWSTDRAPAVHSIDCDDDPSTPYCDAPNTSDSSQSHNDHKSRCTDDPKRNHENSRGDSNTRGCTQEKHNAPKHIASNESSHLRSRSDSKDRGTDGAASSHSRKEDHEGDSATRRPRMPLGNRTPAEQLKKRRITRKSTPNSEQTHWNRTSVQSAVLERSDSVPMLDTG